MKTIINYDPKNDVAYSSFCIKAPVSLQTREEEPEVIVFRDSQTNVVVGFTILDVRKSNVWKESLKSLGHDNLITEVERISV